MYVITLLWFFAIETDPMANGIPKKQKAAEQLRKKRVQATSAMCCAAKVPPRAHHYPVKRSSLGKRQALAIEGEKDA